MTFKIKNLLCALVYVTLFVVAYEEFLYEYFEYYGFYMNNQISLSILVTFLISTTDPTDKL